MSITTHMHRVDGRWLYSEEIRYSPSRNQSGNLQFGFTVRQYSDLCWSFIRILGGSSALSRRVSLSLTRNLCQSATQATLACDVYNLAVLTGMGEVAYRRADGIYVIPIRALGA